MKELGRKNKEKNNLKNEKIEKEYLICPEFLKLNANSENGFASLMKELKEKYPESKTNNSVLIMEKPLKIKDEIIMKKIVIFFSHKKNWNQRLNNR